MIVAAGECTCVDVWGWRCGGGGVGVEMRRWCGADGVVRWRRWGDGVEIC